MHLRTAMDLPGRDKENFNSDILTVLAKSTIFYLLAGMILPRASVAQSVEQLIRNQQVEGSNPSAGSPYFEILI
jgi:hypothetical protein